MVTSVVLVLILAVEGMFCDSASASGAGAVMDAPISGRIGDGEGLSAAPPTSGVSVSSVSQSSVR